MTSSMFNVQPDPLAELTGMLGETLEVSAPVPNDPGRTHPRLFKYKSKRPSWQERRRKAVLEGQNYKYVLIVNNYF